MISTFPPKGLQKTRKTKAVVCSLPCTTVTPWKSHPNRYWHIDNTRIVDAARDAVAQDAELYLINYATNRTGKGANEIKIIQVKEVDTIEGVTPHDVICTTRVEFEKWRKQLLITRTIV